MSEGVQLLAGTPPRPEDRDQAQQIAQAQERYLLLDPRPPEEMEERILRPLSGGSVWYWIALLILGGAVLTAGLTWLTQMYSGMGITGLNRPVMWAVYIANFVYFIGIGVAGTFISAVLRLLKFPWRAPVTRTAEMLTVFALATSGLFPLIHLGRTWKFYWMLPYPNQRGVWPSYHSALMWDMTAILIYLSSSILYAWLAMLPDLGTARDRFETGWRHKLFKVLAVGWRGTEGQWRTLKTAITLFSLAIIPVMVFMHTIVGWDFAMALQPEWHSSVFGPYFVTGALLSGAAAVIIVLAIVRRTLHLEYFVRPEHFDGMGKLLLVFSVAWAYMYFNDYLVPWYGQEPVAKVIDAVQQHSAALGNPLVPAAADLCSRHGCGIALCPGRHVPGTISDRCRHAWSQRAALRLGPVHAAPHRNPDHDWGVLPNWLPVPGICQAVSSHPHVGDSRGTDAPRSAPHRSTGGSDPG
jgi:Ni/Fe-hydrogenase subunit HybB-like protein